MKVHVACFFLCLCLGSPSFARISKMRPSGVCERVLDYNYFSLCYDSRHRQASWVHYKLTLELVNGKQKRTNNYRLEPRLSDPVYKSDFRGSGYDRGHLLPAADMKLNYQSMSDTFFMTNISPQKPGFNRRIWANIERRVRSLVREYGEAYVATAGVLDNSLPQISTGVSIPRLYYKVLYFPEVSMMKAYLIENRFYEDSRPDDFLVTVDEIEALTGFDFFSDLPDHLERRLESQLLP